MMKAIEIEPQIRLKRYFYLNSEESRYYVTRKTCYESCQLSKVTSIFELITADKEELVLELVDSANNDCLCTNREALFFALAVIARNAKYEKTKMLAYNKVLQICNSTKELFLFIKLIHSLNKSFAHGIRRILHNYYSKKDPMELLQIVTHCKSYFGWSHKDLFKLAHLKPVKKSAQEIIFTYVMKNLTESKKLLQEFKANENTSLLHDIIRNLENLDALKHCQDEQQAAKLIAEHNFQVQQLPSNLFKSQIVWETLIPKMDIPTLLPELMRLNRLGFLKSNSTALQKVVDILTDKKKCFACKIHPAQVLIYLKTFERGKPLDPQRKAYIDGLMKTENVDMKKKELIHTNPPKNNAIISALYNLLQHSFKNVHSTGRRFLITLDVREEQMKNLCYTNKSITCFEAAVLIALSIVKAEKDVIVAVFNDDKVTVVPIDKNSTFPQAVQKLKETKGGCVVINNTFRWALENKKPTDVFLNLIYSVHTINQVPKEFKSSENMLLVLKRYRQKVHLPNTKMITVSLGDNRMGIADGSPYILDVCGFNQDVPKVIEACCKGILS